MGNTFSSGDNLKNLVPSASEASRANNLFSRKLYNLENISNGEEVSNPPEANLRLNEINESFNEVNQKRVELFKQKTEVDNLRKRAMGNNSWEPYREPEGWSESIDSSCCEALKAGALALQEAAEAYERGINAWQQQAPTSSRWDASDSLQLVLDYEELSKTLDNRTSTYSAWNIAVRDWRLSIEKVAEVAAEGSQTRQCIGEVIASRNEVIQHMCEVFPRMGEDDLNSCIQSGGKYEAMVDTLMQDCQARIEKCKEVYSQVKSLCSAMNEYKFLEKLNPLERNNIQEVIDKSKDLRKDWKKDAVEPPHTQKRVLGEVKDHISELWKIRNRLLQVVKDQTSDIGKVVKNTRELTKERKEQMLLFIEALESDLGYQMKESVDEDSGDIGNLVNDIRMLAEYKKEVNGP